MMNRSLSSATKWLSSTAYKLFSSSNESTSDDDESIYSTQSTPPSKPSKRKEASSQLQANKSFLSKRVNKQPSSGPNRQNKTFHRELVALQRVTHSRTRSSQVKLTASDPEEDEVRFMLTLKALPPALRVIAQLLHPVPQSAQEEHLLTCKLMASEELQSKRDEITIPTFKRLPSLRSAKEAEKTIQEKEIITDDACLHRHRPLELAEKRERRREDELIRYEQYIRKLSREYPELLNRKYSFSSSSSSMG